MPSEQLVPVSQDDRIEQIGDALAAAWNADTPEAQGLPPIDLIGSERDYLARAILATLSPQEPSSEYRRGIEDAAACAERMHHAAGYADGPMMIATGIRQLAEKG